MKIVPITLKAANEYVANRHRHHKPVVGCKFCIGVEDNGQLVGVAICGRPVSRHLDDGKIWTGARKRDNGVPQELKKRYVYLIE